jgi:hypothetical protein
MVCGSCAVLPTLVCYLPNVGSTARQPQTHMGRWEAQHSSHSP